MLLTYAEEAQSALLNMTCQSLNITLTIHEINREKYNTYDMAPMFAYENVN